MEGPLKDAETDNHSKKGKIVPIEEGHMDETPLDAEKGLPTVIPTENAETDPSEGDKAEEGKRSEASQSKCSKLQSFIFRALRFGLSLGSPQKFFMSQVR